jgi:hypothetical protein
MPKAKELSLEDIFAANDVDVKSVDVPEWGGTVYVKAWTAGEREQFEQSILTDDGKINRNGFRAKAVALSLCDSEGNLLFANGEIDKLQTKSAASIDRIFAACDAQNKITGDEEKEAEGN